MPATSPANSAVTPLRPPAPRRPRRPGPARSVAVAVALAAAGSLTACAPPAPDAPGGAATRAAPSDAAALEALEARLAERFTPGLHSLMLELQHRHASLWFAADAGNWPLADYVMHEVEELIEDIETLHPDYDGIPVADMLAEMTTPAVERLEAAVDAADGAAFTLAYDQLTTACNACHVASDRAAIVIERPTSPPLTNLRYLPRP
jgi:hypothetical protein